MTRHHFLCRRIGAALLALLLTMSLVPAALAAAGCPKCGGELTCTDNGDGRTHTVSCPEDGYTDLTAPHEFADSGRCTACGAMDYSKVHIVLPTGTEFTAARNDSDASLSLSGVRLMLGTETVTGEYTLSYSWYHKGSFVSTGQRCALPSSVISTEGEYDFVCFVTAVPGNALAGKTISASCTVKVHVRDLISAGAVIGSRDLYLSLGDTTGRTPVSVTAQISQAVKEKGGQPSYVVFDEKPHSPSGDLKITAGERYYFSGEEPLLSQARFEPDSAGTYAIGFTAYDAEGNACPGLLTIAVEQSLGSTDVLCTTEKGHAAALSAKEFQDFWREAYPKGTLTLVRFTNLPAASAGVLRRDYVSSARPGTPVEAGQSFYVDAADQEHSLLDGLAFVPGSRFTGPVSLPFEAYGSDGSGNQTYRSGRLFLFVNPKEVEPISCSVASGGSLRFSAAEFLSLYQNVTGSRGNSFYIRFLEVPASGDLYTGRTSSSAGTRLTAASIGEKAFPYSAISSLSYVAGDAAASVRYGVYSSAGELLYVGQISFSLRQGYENPFSDIRDSDWFYPYVTDLAEKGVISGTSANTFSPKADVTWGEALKLVLLATGYGQQPSDGGHWASGYLSRALSAKLIKESVPLNQKITRGELADLAARALKLRLNTRVEDTPFQDVSPACSSAPAIVALYDAGIVEGSTLPGGQSLYRPDEPLRRSEIAAIIWRIQRQAEKK